jgi:hypothetical protein
MTVTEKRAWFVLAVCLIAIVAVVTIYEFTENFAGAMGGMGVLGFSGLTPLIGFRRKRRGEVIVDERDRAILQSAGRIAFGAFWLAFVGAVVGLIKGAGNTSTIHVSTIGSALWFGWLLISVVHSSSVLWMSRFHRAR